ncbi:unnamed protein product [Rotaria socialis]|uniref:Uncharacterized protein n=1 Tax=Rotaria socialis TaxID=392032 RepID=A0A821I6Q7_9BILA|nr:unnamed protein product [Rotaria socialis]
MNVLPKNQRSDIKNSPSTSTIGPSQLTDKLTTEDECQLLMKLYGDCKNSIIPIENYQEKLSSSRRTDSTMNQLLQIPSFSDENSDDSGHWLDQILAFIEQQNVNTSEQRD